MLSPFKQRTRFLSDHVLGCCKSKCRFEMSWSRKLLFTRNLLIRTTCANHCVAFSPPSNYVFTFSSLFAPDVVTLSKRDEAIRFSNDYALEFKLQHSAAEPTPLGYVMLLSTYPLIQPFATSLRYRRPRLDSPSSLPDAT